MFLPRVLNHQKIKHNYFSHEVRIRNIQASEHLGRTKCENQVSPSKLHLPEWVLFTVASLLFTPVLNLFLCEKVQTVFQLQQYHPKITISVVLRSSCPIKRYPVTLLCVLLSTPFLRNKCLLLVRNVLLPIIFAEPWWQLLLQVIENGCGSGVIHSIPT